jgi:hypothetical protein
LYSGSQGQDEQLDCVQRSRSYPNSASKCIAQWRGYDISDSIAHIGHSAISHRRGYITPDRIAHIGIARRRDYDISNCIAHIGPNGIAL